MRATFDDWQAPANAIPRSARLIVDEGPPPVFFRALVQKADVILRARVTSVGAPAEELVGAKTPLAVHLDPLAILEMLKAPAEPLTVQDALQLMQFGGTHHLVRPRRRDHQRRRRDPPQGPGSHRLSPEAPRTGRLRSGVLGGGRVRGARTKAARSASPKDARELPELFGKTSMPLDDLRVAIGKAARPSSLHF